jgi:tetratricopeptide (TPR) repeat protein
MARGTLNTRKRILKNQSDILMIHKNDHMENNEAAPIIRGAFSTRVVSYIGTGTTKKKAIQTFLYYGEENEDGDISLRPLNAQKVPQGDEQIVSKDELLDSFSPELELYTNEVFPAMKKLGKILAKADRQRQLGNTFTAEMEYDRALDIDECNIRANFGIGLCYLKRQDYDKAQDIFKRIVGLNAAFQKKHKHLFNEFGISLRKSGMYSEAVEYYERALEFTDSDENLYFNLARAHAENGNYKNALTFVRKSLILDPDHESSLKLEKFLNYKIKSSKKS